MSYNFYISVNDRPIDEYGHEGDTYVEGRKGKPYTITYWNRTNKRQKIVVSVDGLNVMTGDSTWQQGYVVPPNDYIDIPGWRKDGNNVAAFEFSSVKGSYNQHNDSGDKNNVGVIGCKVYNEKEKPVTNIVYRDVHHYHQPWVPYVPYNPWQYYTLNYHTTVELNAIQNASQLSGGVGQASYTCSNMAGSAECASGSPLRSANFVGMVQSDAMPEIEQQSLGTGWGENKEFKTVNVFADWETNPIDTHVIYYDERRGLERRGIELIKPHRDYVKPKAFPDGCPPPKYSIK